MVINEDLRKLNFLGTLLEESYFIELYCTFLKTLLGFIRFIILIAAFAYHRGMRIEMFWFHDEG